MGMVSLEMLRKDPNSLSAMVSGEEVPATGPKPRLSGPMLEASAAYLIHLYRTTTRAMDLPYPQAIRIEAAAAADLEARSKRGDVTVMLAAILSPVYTQFSEQHARATARRGAMRRPLRVWPTEPDGAPCRPCWPPA